MSKYNWPIIGHQKIINYLQTGLANNSLGHAYLFYGPSGLGKSLVAETFIKSIFCTTPSNNPCHTCAYCRQIEKQVYPDVIYIKKDEDKHNIAIEQIRAAKAKISRSTFLNSYKIILVAEAESLSLSASNALLKVLEEPTPKTIFIFLAANLDHIPATILSRVQSIKFTPVNFRDIEKYLVAQGLGKEEAYELSHLSAGFPGRIMALAKSPASLRDYKNKIKESLNSFTFDINTSFKIAENLASQTNSPVAKAESKQFLDRLSLLLRDVVLIKTMNFDKIIHTYLQPELNQLAPKYSLLKLANIIKSVKQTKRYIDQNVNLRLALENLFLEF